MTLFFCLFVFLPCESFSCLKIISAPHEVENGEQGGARAQSVPLTWASPGAATLSDDFEEF